MKQYLDLVRTILEEGSFKPNRTGIDTISYFAYPFRHDLKDGFPLLTTKKMDGKLWNSIVEELLWFIEGQNHIRDFKKKSGIWDSWADENGSLETSYGWYWRHFPHTGGTMEMIDDRFKSSIPDLEKMGNFDQLGWCVEQLKTNPNNRRLVVSAWEPYNAHKSKLPPCHAFFVFNVQKGRLCLHLTQRSCDCMLGIPFNIASYALLTHIIAKEVGLEPGILSMMFVDAHIYAADENDETIVNGAPRKDYDHVRQMKEQLLREPLPLPTLEIADCPWDQHKFDNFKLTGYTHHGVLRGKVAV